MDPTATESSTVTGSLQEEQRHLKTALTKINHQLNYLNSIPRYFSSDSEEPQTADEVAQQAVDLIREAQIEALSAASSEPYFGRLDFQETGEHGPSALYIGKRGVEDSDSGERLVIDWRAPIASMFYSFTGKGEQASYDAPDGPIDGQVYLKRNIVVRQGELQRVVDSYVKGQENLNVTDEFLLYRLADTKDNRLRDIVSTIQAEQDKIIRADRTKAIVIQGVAGSGKTTVALHRLAYLLYQHSDKLRTDRMVIFAPNAMFVDYISEVLPELGVGGIRQTTFQAWALEVLEHTVHLNDPAERLSRWFGVTRDNGLHHEFQITQFKGSLEFMDKLNQYITDMEQSFLPSEDFVAWDGAVLPESTIRQWYLVDYSNYPLAQRKQRVLARVKRWYEIEYKNIKESDRKGTIKKQASNRYRAYEKRWPQLSALQIYQEVLAQSIDLLTGIHTVAKTKTTALQKGRRPVVDLEDLAPLVYIHVQLNGIGGQSRFDHVVMDEAQDFSPMQIAILKAHCPSQAFTILGDLSQSIHTYQGITDWGAFLDQFNVEQRAFFQLDVSYRSTMEIIDYANAIIESFEGFTLAKPVFRSGEPVHVTQVTERERLIKAVEAVRSLQIEAQTIAVVGRTDEDCQLFHAALEAAGISANLIDSKQQQYSGGISVLPVYLTKGLEFDAVLLVDANETYYDKTPLSAKLLYVGCTRALHKLWIQYAGTPSPLLPNSQSNRRGAAS